MRLGVSQLIYVGALLVSLVAHVGAIFGLSSADKKTAKSVARVVEMELISIEAPATDEPQPVQPNEPPRPEVKKPPPPEKPADALPPPVQEPPPSNSEVAPDEAAPPVYGITMRSTVSGGAKTKVRVGNTLMKDPDSEFTDSKDVQDYRGAPKQGYVSPSRVSKMAKRIGDCRGQYPAEAKSLGIEGAVKLMISIEDDGSVSRAEVLSGLGYGLDEAAVEALKRCRFEPALQSGAAVAIKVPYTYRFELDAF